MKLISKAILVCALSLGFVATAMADVNIVPKVGYQFQTTNTNNKQIDTIGQFQKNHATYGVEVNADVDALTQVGVEYLRTDSNNDSYQVGVIANRTLGETPFYATGGVGYYKLSGDVKNIESPFVNVGVGVQKQLTNLIKLKGEVRGQYVTNENQWTPIALVGFEFNTTQFNKPFSR